jgi:hypothetical protein
MEDLKNKAENLTDHISDYVETYIKLTVLKATDKATGFASNSVSFILISMFAFFVLLFSGIGLGLWIGQKLENMLAGFCIIAGFYALLATVILVFRKNLIMPFIRNIIIRKTYE